MAEIVKICVPDIGDFSDVPIVEIPVAPGDMVADGDTIIVVESDKATLDVPADVDGKIVSLEVAEGDLVSAGTLIAMIELAGDAKPPQPAEPKEEAPARTPQEGAAGKQPIAAPAAAKPQDAPAIPPANATKIHASPSIRRFARTLGVDLTRVSSTGPKGRILREDVENFVKVQMQGGATERSGTGTATIAGLPDWPQVDFAKFGPIERQPLSRIVKISGPALARNAMVIPHVTNFEKADVTDLEAFRKSMNAEVGPDGTKLTMLAFSVKAIVSGLKAFPKFNSSLDGDELVIKNYWNIGVAADTPNGLVVPVVKNADQKGLLEIAAEMKELAGAARSGKLRSEDMQGATFTISSLGGIGGTNFTPIINAPEVAILGMPRSEIQPVWDGDAFQPRLIQPLGLSFDHRVIDGVASAHFLAHVARVFGDFRRLSL